MADLVRDVSHQSATEEQSQASVDINKDLEYLSDLTHSVLDMTERMKPIVSQTRGCSKTLANPMGRFRV